MTDPFARAEDDHTRKQTELIAKAYDPQGDAMAQAIADLDKPSPSQRMALGYHESAREAANKTQEK